MDPNSIPDRAFSSSSSSILLVGDLPLQQDLSPCGRLSRPHRTFGTPFRVDAHDLDPNKLSGLKNLSPVPLWDLPAEQLGSHGCQVPSSEQLQ